MRKIMSGEEIAAKEKKRNVVISIILLGIMLLSTAGFAFIYNFDSAKSVQGGKVQSYGDRWAVDIGGNTVTFTISPDEALNGTTMGFISNLNQFYNMPLYVDTDNDAVYSEIGSSLGLYAARVQHGCYSDCSDSEWPEKDCTNNLIVFRENVSKSITQNQSCVFIDGDMGSVDAFLYKTLGLA